MTIPALIDKQDNFEIVRDQIAAILALEVASQMALATAAAKDPDDWKLRVYIERSNPWEVFLNDDTDRSPLVNVWFDNSNFPQNRGNVVERQGSESVFNLDCYGYGRSADDPIGGHIPGDSEAALEAQRAIRLVRNILMASEYTYLGLRGVVGRRWPRTITVFQPQIDSRPVQQIVAGRISLDVYFNELSPQAEGEALEYISAVIKRAEDGQVIINADYDFTP